MADPFDFSQIGIPTPQVVPSPQGGPVATGVPASQIPPGMGPPADEKDFEVRKRGWENFFNLLGSDPNLRNALLAFGTTALQPRVGAQTSAGQIGKALQAGMQTFEQGRRADTQEELRRQQLGLQSRGLDIQERGVRQSGELGRERIGLEREQLEQQRKLEQQRLRIYQSQVEGQNRAIDSSQELKELQGALIQAQIAETYPNHPKTQAEIRRIEAQADALAAQAAKDKALAARGGTASANSVLDKYNYLARTMLELNPTMTPAEAKLQAVRLIEGEEKDPQKSTLEFMRVVLPAVLSNPNLMFEDDGGVEKALGLVEDMMHKYLPEAKPQGASQAQPQGQASGVTPEQAIAEAAAAWEKYKSLYVGREGQLVEEIKAQAKAKGVPLPEDWDPRS